MAIVNTELPMTPQRSVQAMEDLVRAYPFARTEELTTTAFHRPLRTLVLGTGPRKVIYAAAFHGNEWITAPILLKFAEELAKAFDEEGSVFDIPASRILETATIYMVHMVDPDGVALVTGEIQVGTLEYEQARRLADNYPAIPFPDGWKANLLGVDLNLQYPAGWLQAREIKFSQGYTLPGPRDYVGRAPLSQRESRALAGYTEVIDPALVLALHSQGREIYWQFGQEVPGARELGEEFARVSGYALADTPYESSFAGYKDWFIQNFRRPGFTIEVGQGRNPLPIEQFPQIYNEVLGILATAAMGG